MPSSRTARIAAPLPPYVRHPLSAEHAWSVAARSHAWLLVVVAAVVVAALLRLPPVLNADFPLNDGGLFYRMVEELRDAHYRLPATTSYNLAEIPFGYPPLGFYLAALVSSATGQPLVDVVRVLPAVVSTLTVPVFFLLARALLGSVAEGAVATFSFALLPRTFTWFIMGGGLTRAPGFFFALLFLHQAYLMYTRPERRFVATTAVAGALAVLAHLESGWFAAYSGGLLFLLYGRDRRGVVRSLIVAGGVLALSAPWWATVIRYHGLHAFAAAAQGGGPVSDPSWLKTFNFTDEPQLTLFGALGLVGVFAAVARRQWLLPLWLGAIYLFNPRNPKTVAAVPLAMLVALALYQVIVPGILRLSWREEVASSPQGRRSGFAPLIVAVMLALFTAYSFLSVRRIRDFDEGYGVLTPADRETFRWISANTAPDARIVVLSFEPDWFGYDRVTEWLPALTRRVSVSTVQGYEWLPNHEFARRVRRYDALHACATRDIGCVERWASADGTRFTHVLFRKEGCCALLESSLRASPAYRLIADRPDAAVFVRTRNP
jgi:hypothetical protein